MVQLISVDFGPRGMELPTLKIATLSEETAHPTVYHHISKLSVGIQLTRLNKCS